jgi:6-phosphogluconate dehydrogenase
MHLGYIGLGKMGKNMVARLLEKKHHVTVFDINTSSVRACVKKGAEAARSYEDLANKLGKKHRVFWIMVPHEFVSPVIDELTPFLKKGDTVIDGGNSPYEESKLRSLMMRRKGIHFIDVGVSGGPKGALNGSCLMVGGDKRQFTRLETLWKDLAVKGGYGYMGRSGAGHFVKMIHNGIEYGMMQSIAEGFDVMHRSREYDLNMRKISEVYANGSVISSSLMTWMAGAYKKYGNDLDSVTGRATGTGEATWTLQVARRLRAPAKVILEAWRARKRTQNKPSFQGKIIMALRNQFGGHSVKDN